MSLLIGHKNIGLDHPPLIIAEMSGNHNQSLDRALKLVEVAYESGADGIKLQTYTADTMTLDIKEGNFKIKDPSSLWSGKNLYDLFKEAYTPWEWHAPIMERANQLGMICFSSPFDETAVDFLESLNVPAYKIASFENNHIPLIKKAAQTKKPLIISCGMASLSQIEKAIYTAKSENCENIILLKCTSNYPSEPINANIRTIKNMRDLFNLEIGLSDHTSGIGVALASIAFGSTIIEKHFTLDRNDGGVDSKFSLEPHELTNLVIESKRAWQALGRINYGPTKNEKSSLIYRRSIYISKDIDVGEEFSSKNLKIIRPGDGAEPELFYEIIGKKAKKSFRRGNPLKLSDLL